MKNLLKLEQLSILALSLFFLYRQDLNISWWLWPILFLSPDLGMLGYLINPRVGAVTYNLLHHQGIAGVALIIGFVLVDPYLITAGLLLFAHSAFDRVLGYGLKYPDSFHNTHLGIIGSKK